MSASATTEAFAGAGGRPVYVGPIFSAPIACHVGETVERDEFVFCDVLAADE